jgi:hypothetical protein
MNKNENLRYHVHGGGETTYSDSLQDAYSLAHGMAQHFGHSFIYDNRSHKKIEEFFRD